MLLRLPAALVLLSTVILASPSHAKDYFLTIGGGYSPSGNQASLEKNVLFFQRFLRQQELSSAPQDFYFADGDHRGRDLQVNDPSAVPLANRLMAEFCGSTKDLGMTYRNHQVPDIRGGTTRENIADWFKTVGSTMQPDDRLILYVTSHGGSSSDKSKPHNTVIYLWNNKKISVKELVQHLDGLPDGVSVITVMVQCHSGGFARFIFDEADADNSVATQNRVGFFATVHSRPAAGCTPDIDEANYQEYSSFFWAAMGGEDRLGNSIEVPDYNGDGKVGFDEAHAYTVLTSNTIDLPIKTSGEFLRVHSKFQDDDNPDLLPKDADYPAVLAMCDPVQAAVLEGLSKQLKLDSDDRIKVARSRSGSRSSGSRSRGRGRFGSRRPSSSSSASPVLKLKQQITSELKRKWPELANVVSPVSLSLMTDRKDEFIKAVQDHPKFDEYSKLKAEARKKAQSTLSPTESRVKYERLVRFAENVILAHNLQQLGDDDQLAAFERIRASESGTLRNADASLTATEE